ncbi:MAG: hypothetical protein C5B54_00690 [Acidobacteria bacterium]|nr:MAG: hypothetical protein C5B54_00690 [Acidobacteriota bacterium]
MRLVYFLSIGLLLIAFVGLSQASSGNLLYLELGSRTVGTGTTYKLYSRSTDHTGRPISPLQAFALCHGQPSNGCVVVGIAPFLNGNSLTVLTENTLTQQNFKILLQEYNFSFQPNNTLTLTQVRDLATPNGFSDSMSGSCFHVTQSGTQDFLVHSITLSGSRGQVVAQPFDPVTGIIASTTHKLLPPFSAIFTNQFVGCDYVFDGKVREAQLLYNNGAYILQYGKKKIEIAAPPTNENIIGFAISKQNQFSPTLPAVILYDLGTSASNGFSTQAFTQAFDPSSARTVGSPNPITNPLVFKGSSLSLFHSDSINDGDGLALFGATIGFGLGHSILTSTPLNQSTGGKAGASRVLGRIPMAGTFYLGVWVEEW